MKLCLIINFPSLYIPYVKYTYFNIAQIFIYGDGIDVHRYQHLINSINSRCGVFEMSI